MIRIVCNFFNKLEMIDIWFIFPSNFRTRAFTILFYKSFTLVFYPRFCHKLVIAHIPKQASRRIIYWRKIRLETLSNRPLDAPIIEMPIIISNKSIKQQHFDKVIHKIL